MCVYVCNPSEGHLIRIVHNPLHHPQEHRRRVSLPVLSVEPFVGVGGPSEHHAALAGREQRWKNLDANVAVLKKKFVLAFVVGSKRHRLQNGGELTPLCNAPFRSVDHVDELCFVARLHHFARHIVTIDISGENHAEILMVWVCLNDQLIPSVSNTHGKVLGVILNWRVDNVFLERPTLWLGCQHNPLDLWGHWWGWFCSRGLNGYLHKTLSIFSKSIGTEKSRFGGNRLTLDSPGDVGDG